MYLLDGPLKSWEVLLLAAPATTAPTWVSAWVEPFARPFAGGSADGVAGTSAVAAVAAPAPGVLRQVKGLCVQQADSGPLPVQVRLNSGGQLRPLWSGTLQPGDLLQYEDRTGWSVIDGTGALRSSGAGGATDVDLVYAPLTDPAGPSLVFTAAGDVIMVPD